MENKTNFFSDICFGVPSSSLVTHLVMLGKRYIHRCKISDNKPSFTIFRYHITRTEEVEKKNVL